MSGDLTWAYTELGLPPSPDVTMQQAKEAYRQRAKATHPDSSGGQGNEAFNRLGQAYKAVSEHLASR